VAGGTTADNPFLDSELNVLPADCPAEVSVTTQAWNKELNPDGTPKVGFLDGKSGIILVNGFATQGAAVGIRGYEYNGPKTEPTIEEIMTGDLKFKHVLEGPFDYGAPGDTCEGLRIQFKTEHGHEKLFVVMDTSAKSSSPIINCPEDVTLACDEEVTYPLPTVTGCLSEDIFVHYDPPAELLPAGQTLVTATFTYADGSAVTHPPEEEGDEAVPVECQFLVSRSFAFEGFYAPLKGVGGSCSSPILTANRGSAIPVKFKLLCDGTPIVGGPPPHMRITSCKTGEVIDDGDFQIVGSEWHFNWDTDDLKAAVYELRASLPDGTTKSAYVKIK
jgi:hypothetical protein